MSKKSNAVNSSDSSNKSNAINSSELIRERLLEIAANRDSNRQSWADTKTAIVAGFASMVAGMFGNERGKAVFLAVQSLYGMLLLKHGDKHSGKLLFGCFASPVSSMFGGLNEKTQQEYQPLTTIFATQVHPEYTNDIESLVRDLLEQLLESLTEYRFCQELVESSEPSFKIGSILAQLVRAELESKGWLISSDLSTDPTFHDAMHFFD